jgi:tetratricopeptide (TPR) repeat protein
MRTLAENCFDLIDRQRGADLIEPYYDIVLEGDEQKEDCVLALQICKYMYAKLSVEAYEKDPMYASIEKEVKGDIYRFLDLGKTNREITDYIHKATPKQGLSILEKAADAEQELYENGIDQLTETWLAEIDSEKKNKATEKFLKAEVSYSRADDSAFKNKAIQVPAMKRIYIWSATAAACLLIAFLVRWWVDAGPNNERLFAKYHESPEELRGFNTRNPDAEISLEFERARTYYNSGSYEEAYSIFHQLAVADPGFPEAAFYSGIAQFEAGHYEASIDKFESVIKNFDLYDIEAKWYIALAYIKINTLSKAVPYLNDIAHQKNNRQADAQALLKAIHQ